METNLTKQAHLNVEVIMWLKNLNQADQEKTERGNPF